MSGGRFEYKQFHINDIADEIEKLIINNTIPPDDETWVNNYPPEVIEKFQEAWVLLKAAAIYAHRIDWLVSGDDGIESFFEYLQEDIDTFDKEETPVPNI